MADKTKNIGLTPKPQMPKQISEQDRAYATLISSGLWSQIDAHIVIYPESKAKPEYRRQNAALIARKPEVVAYRQKAMVNFVTQRESSMYNPNNDRVSERDSSGVRTKDDIRREMNENIDAESDKQKKHKMLMELANLDALKGNNDTGVEDERVVFYTPITCINDCPLYKAEQKRKGLK